MSTIGLKVNKEFFSAECIKIIRSVNEMSISEIKNKILNEDYILTSDDVDDDGIMQIVNLYTLLDKANINCYLYDDNDRIGIEILNNLLSMYNEINEKVNREMEEEAKKEGE